MMRSAFLLFALIANLRAMVVADAVSRIGTPYRYGSASERAVDCSGLVQLSYAAIGISVPRTSGDQFRATTRVEPDRVAAGDLVFFGSSAKNRIYHVGIMIDRDYFVHAESHGRGVRIEKLSHVWYASRLAGFGRVKMPWPLAAK
jgi:cell wall-associated NlpC family hydrolase